MASGTTTSGGGLADRYAAALYAQAEDTRELDQTVSEMDQLGQLIDSSPEFRRLLDSPLIDVTQAHAAGDAVLSGQGFGKLVRNFVGVITNNSVEATARSGGNLGFAVTVVSDACYTFDQTDLSGRLWPAEDVHALSLSNLAMDYAAVMETDEILVHC